MLRSSVIFTRHTKHCPLTPHTSHTLHTPHTSHTYTATPADVSLLMQLGVDGVFVGSGIFKSGNPEKRAKAMVQAVTHYKDPTILAQVSENLGDPMVS